MTFCKYCAFSREFGDFKFPPTDVEHTACWEAMKAEMDEEEWIRQCNSLLYLAAARSGESFLAPIVFPTLAKDPVIDVRTLSRIIAAAAWEGAGHILQTILDNASFLDEIDFDEVMIDAIDYGETSTVKVLLENGIVDPNGFKVTQPAAVITDGPKPVSYLALAAREGDLPMLDVMVEHGAVLREGEPVSKTSGKARAFLQLKGLKTRRVPEAAKRIAHNRLLGVSMALGQALPPYVLLEVCRWLPFVTPHFSPNEKKLVQMFQRVRDAHQRPDKLIKLK